MNHSAYQNRKITKKTRKTERISLLFVSAVFVFALLILYNNLKDQFKTVEKSYQDKITLNLNSKTSVNDLNKLLLNGNYVSTPKDAQFISSELMKKLSNENIENLGTLNKDAFKISTSYADSLGGKEIKTRIAESQRILQWSPEIEHLYQNGNLKSSTKVNSGDLIISVLVNKKDHSPVSGVVVRIKEHVSYTQQQIEEIKGIKKVFPVENDTIVAYAITNDKGLATFTGLNKEKHYSVLPIKKWCEFGASKGTISEPLSKNKEFVFTEKEHKIKLFGTLTYSQIKNDKTFTVRTPTEFLNSAIPYIVGFFLIWWLIHIYLVIRRKEVDELILPILMTLSGICIFSMYAMQNPVSDVIRGNEMVLGLVGGLLLLLGFLEVNLLKFYNSKWFDPFFKSQKGLLYFVVALLLTSLLFPFGDGPEGSGVKVNLFFFQPSEITKYLMLIFFAAFFSKNADILSKIPRNIRFRFTFIIFIALLLILVVYGLLGDMGPALVLGFTFILIYSVARRDLPQLIIGIISFVLMLYFATKLTSEKSLQLLGVFSLIWLIGWIAYGWIAKRTFYESAILFNLVIAAFIFGEVLPYVGDRLNDRNSIYSNIWDNQVYGGDQIAQGIWSLSSGGFGGQGLGQGNPNVVPAFHTDMIFTSIGEELGWIGLVLIILCFAILLHRTLLIGRRAGNPFAFYLAAGIAIVTGVQFIIITFGSTGLIPLTGVTVPFLSFGKVSMIINIAAFGIVLSLSKNKGTERQQKSISKNYDSTIAFGGLAFTATSFVLIGTLLYYQVIARNTYIVKPAIVADKIGERIRSDNPRIGLLMNELQGGNIYDRNNILLATGNKDLIKNSLDSYNRYGVTDSLFTKEIQKRSKRYYPFGNQLFFILGDFNTRNLWSDVDYARAYNAEARHLSYLRGFDTKPRLQSFSSDHYRKDRFSPLQEKFEASIPLYDYSELAPLLKAGINSNKVRQFNNVKRDLHLTVDAELQTKLQNQISEAFAKGSFMHYKDSKVSVVVLNANNGEFLASANYPLPNQDHLKALYENNQKNELQDLLFTERDMGMTYPTAPGSTAKIISSLAGFKKMGTKAKDIVYPVSENEIFRTGREGEPVGNDITHETAIVKSSNVYFIKLINEENLDNELAEIYLNAGIAIGGKNKSSYQLSPMQKQEQDKTNKQLQQKWKSNVFAKNRGAYDNKKLPAKRRLQSEFSYLAWGQGQIDATPLSMARISSAVANQGKLIETQYVLKTSNGTKNNALQTYKIVDENSANILKSYMQKQSEAVSSDYIIHGKTGTPTRTHKKNGKKININDAWYIFFVKSEKAKGYLSVAVRIEKGIASKNAVVLTKEVIIPVLESLEYLKKN